MVVEKEAQELRQAVCVVLRWGGITKEYTGLQRIGKEG